jgi:hypothetical protein
VQTKTVIVIFSLAKKRRTIHSGLADGEAGRCAGLDHLGFGSGGPNGSVRARETSVSARSQAGDHSDLVSGISGFSRCTKRPDNADPGGIGPDRPFSENRTLADFSGVIRERPVPSRRKKKALPFRFMFTSLHWSGDDACATMLESGYSRRAVNWLMEAHYSGLWKHSLAPPPRFCIPIQNTHLDYEVNFPHR